MLRKNGTYKDVHVNAKKKSFTLDKNVYEVTSYKYGKLFGIIPWLKEYYIEGLPYPIKFDVDYELKKVKLKIDSKAIRNVTNKKILDVFGDAELTKLEQIVIMIMCAVGGISAVCMILLFAVLDKLTVLVP